MNLLSSSDDESIKTRFRVSASVDPCTQGVLRLIIMKNEHTAILLFDNEVGNNHKIQMIIFSHFSF